MQGTGGTELLRSAFLFPAHVGIAHGCLTPLVGCQTTRFSRRVVQRDAEGNTVAPHRVAMRRLCQVISILAGERPSTYNTKLMKACTQELETSYHPTSLVTQS